MQIIYKNIGKLAPYENFPLHVIHALCLRTHLFQRKQTRALISDPDADFGNGSAFQKVTLSATTPAPRTVFESEAWCSRRLALICAKRGISYTRYVHVRIVRLSRPYRRLSPACELMCIKISHHRSSKNSA